MASPVTVSSPTLPRGPEVEVTNETNEQLDRIEAQLIEMNSKLEWRVFWGVLGALIAFIVLGIILGIFLIVVFGEVVPV